MGIRSNASIALIACALLFSPAAAVEAEPAGQAGGKKLLFLGNRALPPMVYLERGKNQGIVIDLVNALAVEMGASVDIHLMDWAAAQRLVALGSADALIQINKTEARLLVYDFSGPLLESRFMIFARGMEKSIHGAADLRGLKVGVEAKGFPQLALQGDSLVRLVTIPTVLEGFKMLEGGRVDAVVVDEWVGQFTLAKIGITDISTVGEPIAVSQSAIAVRKGDAALLAAIEAGLARMRANGSYQAIVDRWEPQSIVYQTREQLQRRLYLFVSIVALLLVLFLVTLAIVLSRRLAAEKRYREDIALKSKLIAEKELILKEVHHRIKNNMGSIISLLSLQAMGGEDPRVKAALDDAAGRIQSMMLLYDRLYRTSSYETLPLDEYLVPLIEGIVANFPNRDDIALETRIDGIVLGPNVLHPLGIMVNELITNIMKHAFKGIAHPRIRVEARAWGDTARISISDNGVGLPPLAETEGRATFGLTLVRELTKQIGGKLEISRHQGTEFDIEFRKQ